MKLLIVRHADPDYPIDSLTERGWTEAEYLSERLSKLNVAAFYVSPLGRAKDTASLTLKKMNRTARECPWLKEFGPPVARPDWKGPGLCPVAWDWLPADWTADERFYEEDHWFERDVFKDAQVKQEYDWVIENFDRLLACHGYERNGRVYRAVRPNNNTIVLFCHFGVECVLLSHLLGVSPMILWHGICAAPSSVTTVISEERRQGVALFRANAIGDISHLYVHGMEPAFAARFCECYGNEGERRD